MHICKKKLYFIAYILFYSIVFIGFFLFIFLKNLSLKCMKYTNNKEIINIIIQCNNYNRSGVYMALDI